MRISAIDKDTICALATAQGAGAIAVIRVSGPDSLHISRRLASFLPTTVTSHSVYFGRLRDPDSSKTLDEVVVTYFAEGKSFTGEETIEISCHGASVIVDEILRVLVRLGCRMARPGEFTMRAHLNGRIDLVQAESILDLVQSQSKRVTELALDQLAGHLSRAVRTELNRVTRVLAHLEANIDFASEDIVIQSSAALAADLQVASTALAEFLSGFEQGRVIREGFTVALVGPPNVGKSSLLNALVSEDRAIVTPVAGTTRDFVEGRRMFAGVSVLIVDTAGLRSTTDPVELIGIDRTLERLKRVDRVILVTEIQPEAAIPQDLLVRIPKEKTIVVRSKGDLLSPKEANGFAQFIVSSVSKVGLERLEAWIEAEVSELFAEGSVVSSNARHYGCLLAAKSAVDVARELLLRDETPDLIALELQQGLKALHEMLGEVYDDQIMDRVFSEFCLGK